MKRAFCLALLPMLVLFLALLLPPTAECVSAQYDDRYQDKETGLYFYIAGEQTGLMTEDETVLLEPCLSGSHFRFSEGLALVQEAASGNWGYIDTSGRWIVAPTLESDLNSDFHDGLATAGKDGLIGILNADGSWAAEPKFTKVTHFSEGLCAASTGEKWGYVDATGRFVIEAEYDKAGLFSEGLAPVSKKGSWSYIDVSGETVISKKYIEAEEFEFGMASVEDDKGWFLIDRQGNEVLRVPGATRYEVRDERTIVAQQADSFQDYWYVYYTLTENGYEEVPMVDSTFDMKDYYPHKGGNVARLDEPATLNRRASTEWRLPRVDGATALFPVYAALVEATYPASTRYEEVADNPDALITCSKTSEAYYRLIDGDADIIFVAGPSESQQAYAQAHGVELELTPIAKEAFVFIVNQNNPLSGLSTEQIRDVYSGRTTQWSELGVDDLGDIIAYQRPQNSGSQTALERMMEGDALMEAPQERIASFMEDIVDVVEYRNYPNAIGYSFRFYVTGLIKARVKLLAVDDIQPTVENIASGAYPLITQVYAVTRRGDENPNTAAFLEWVQSDQGMELIQKSGYVPENPS